MTYIHIIQVLSPPVPLLRTLLPECHCTDPDSTQCVTSQCINQQHNLPCLSVPFLQYYHITPKKTKKKAKSSTQLQTPFPNNSEWRTAVKIKQMLLILDGWLLFVGAECWHLQQCDGDVFHVTPQPDLWREEVLPAASSSKESTFFPFKSFFFFFSMYMDHSYLNPWK